MAGREDSHTNQRLARVERDIGDIKNNMAGLQKAIETMHRIIGPRRAANNASNSSTEDSTNSGSFKGDSRRGDDKRKNYRMKIYIPTFD